MSRPFSLRTDLRGSYVGNYAIYYRLIEDDASIEIVRVVHGARDTHDMF